MNTAFASHAQIAAAAAKRPKGYEADLMRCAVERTADGVTFDTEGDCWRELFKKYRGAYPEELGREDIAARGRAAWSKLHTEGIGKGADWLAEWEKGIPCGECKAKYAVLKAATPPTFPLTFDWGVALHNAINRELGKPEVTAAVARELWP